MLDLLMAPPTGDTFTVSEGVRLVLTSLFSAPLLIAAGAGLLKLTQARKERRLAERKDTHTEDNDLVQHWKQAAENAQKAGRELVTSERESKESALQAVKDLLDVQESQNVGLRDTITRLSDTIQRLTDAGGAASELVSELRAERDHLQRKYDAAMLRVEQLTRDLLTRQRALLPADMDTQELDALDAHLQAKVDTGEIPLPPYGEVRQP